MTDRYWEADEPPDTLLDWVNKNVCEAIKDVWEIDNPIGWIDVEGETVLLIVAGPEKPMDQSNIFTLKFNLVDQLAEYAMPYADIGGPRGDKQREDMRERAATLHRLSKTISDMAAEADKHD